MSTDITVKSQEFAVALKNNLKSIESVLPKNMDSARFCRVAINAIMKNPSLADCDRSSFVMSVINAAESGLELSLGQGALVPYKGHVQFQPMYQGLIELAERSGKLAGAPYAEVVYEDDEFEYELGLHPILKHKPNPEKQGDMKYVYAVAHMTNGEPRFVVLTKAEVEKIKKTSPGAGSKFSPWQTWESEMWKKTALKRLCKMLPKSIELQRALTLDSQAAAGKKQVPVIADMSASDIDLSSIAGDPEEQDAGLKKPQEKKPKAEKEPEGNPEDEEKKALIDDILKQKKHKSVTFKKACGEAEISEDADLNEYDLDKLVELRALIV